MINGGSNPYTEYKKRQIETSSPEQLILMLYDGAIKFLVQAKIKMSTEKNNIEEISHSLIKAQDIIYELIKSLDIEKGGDIAQNLFYLYEFMLQQLIKANIEKDPAYLVQVIGMIKDLRETWTEVIKIQVKENLNRKNISHNERNFCVAI